jgi:type I restriction enzyme, S subunit
MPFRLLLDPRVAPLVSGHERGTAGTAVSSPTVEWIGEIPVGWGVTKVKYESTLEMKYGLNISSESYSDTGIRFLRTTDLNDDGTLIDEGVYLQQEDVPDEYLTNENDILISRSGSLGVSYLHQIQEPFTYGGYLVRFNFGPTGTSRFVFYYLRSLSFQYWISINTVQSTIGNVNGTKYSNMSFTLPNPSEQQQIVTYLDYKTSLIDDLIQRKTKKIELLKEYRTSLINQVVTKGPDPDVEMKDSGVEWIGEIPVGWVYTRIKYSLEDIIDTEHKTIPFHEDGDYSVVRTTNIKDGKIVSEGIKKTTHEEFVKWTGRGVPRTGDVLLTREAPVGECCVVPSSFDFCMGQRVVWLKVNTGKLNPQFLVYSIYNKNSRMFMENLSIGSTVGHLNMSQIGNIPIFLCPSLPEQNQIVTYLDHKTSEIDDSIQNEDDKIQLLKEYRQSLISEVVTGKIDVREVPVS